MNEYIFALLALIALLGAVSVYLKRSPFDKLIGLAVMMGGVIPLVVMKGYIDVAILIAIIMPLTSIFILQATGRNSE